MKKSEKKPNRDNTLFKYFKSNKEPKPPLPKVVKHLPAPSLTTFKKATLVHRASQPRVLPRWLQPSKDAVDWRMAMGDPGDASLMPNLSSEQIQVLDRVVKSKQNVFFTGSAGTGKSVLLRAMIDILKRIHGEGLAVTASTGIAACNINGCTLHSFGGIGLGSDSVEVLTNQIRIRNKKALERWSRTTVLVIDEISMVDAELFDKLEALARRIRCSDQPFGGIQVIVTGDFFQLPPVNANGTMRFAFEADAWSKVIEQTYMLTQVFRQKDRGLVTLLNEIRLGVLSAKAIEIFKSLSRQPTECSEIQPTELYPLRWEVENSNRKRLEALEGKLMEYQAMDVGDPKKIESCLAPPVVQLKLYAQVMLLKNVDHELVNGSVGVVVGYVGEGAYTKDLHYLRTPQRQTGLYNEPSGSPELDLTYPYPVIRFRSGRELIVERETWSFDLPGGKTQASRTQLPLMLAWAISIHKSQGQTLDHVKVDLGKVFEKGQAYVALSRATALERLQVLNFNPLKVLAHPKVTEFYKTLECIL